MPPKKAAAGASKKTEAKKKEKIIEVRNELIETFLLLFFLINLFSHKCCSSFNFRIKRSV